MKSVLLLKGQLWKEDIHHSFHWHRLLCLNGNVSKILVLRVVALNSVITKETFLDLWKLNALHDSFDSYIKYQSFWKSVFKPIESHFLVFLWNLCPNTKNSDFYGIRNIGLGSIHLCVYLAFEINFCVKKFFDILANYSNIYLYFVFFCWKMSKTSKNLKIK